MEQHELRRYSIEPIGSEVRRRNMDWHHWPIVDGGVPEAAFNLAWPKRSEMLCRLLAAGGRVLIHCRGGLGRTGMIAARLLVDGGVAPTEAIARTRAARPGAIETQEQERWVGLSMDTRLPS
jgi:ADP-ribosyl-[dinitrogen reductase] hydrolase